MPSEGGDMKRQTDMLQLMCATKDVGQTSWNWRKAEVMEVDSRICVKTGWDQSQGGNVDKADPWLRARSWFKTSMSLEHGASNGNAGVQSGVTKMPGNLKNKEGREESDWSRVNRLIRSSHQCLRALSLWLSLLLRSTWVSCLPYRCWARRAQVSHRSWVISARPGRWQWHNPSQLVHRGACGIALRGWRCV